MNPITDPMVRRLGWVLVHSLWQGALVALVLAAALHALRRRSAGLRYILACGALGALAALPVVNFALVPRFHPGATWNASTAPASLASPPFQIVEGIPSPDTAVSNLSFAAGRRDADTARSLGAPARGVPTWSSAVHHFESAFPWVVGAWALGVVLLSVWHLGGWAQVQRIRRAHTRPLGPHWEQRLATLAARLRVTRPVRLVESALVQVPTVIGWLRPVVLVPAAAVSGLAPHQLEAILAHELAHVRRHDYLVNVLQAAIETLLFYHPAVWWVSGQVRLKREHCCDDVASAACGGPLRYARALAALEELRSGDNAGAAPWAQFALAVDGGGPLLCRIRRLAGITPPATSRRPLARSVGGAAAVAAVASLALPLAVVGVQRPNQNVDAPAITNSTQFAPAPAKPAAAKQPAQQLGPGDAAALQAELSRLVDERIQVSRDLGEAKNKLANLMKLNSAGNDPPGLEEQLSQDRTYNQYRNGLDDLAMDLAATGYREAHPQAKRMRAQMAALRQKLDDLREQKKNGLFASLGARYQAEVDTNENLIRDVKDRIERVTAAFARAEAGGHDRAAAEAQRNAWPPAPLTVDEVARVDPAMLGGIKSRDELRAALARLRTTMLENHPTVVRLRKELDSQEQAIEEAALEFRRKWVVNNGPGAAPAPAPAPDAGVDAVVRPEGPGERTDVSVYFVSGRVPRPGVYTLGKRRVNLLQALITVGLDVDSNRAAQVMLLRREAGGKEDAPVRETVTSLTVGDLLDHREKDVLLRPDDVVVLKAAPRRRSDIGSAGLSG